MKQILGQCIFLLLMACTSASAIEREDMQTLDLSADGHALAGGQRILLLILTRSDCQYCHALMQNVILPLQKSGVWDARVILRELQLDTSPAILNFSGQSVSAQALAESYGHPFTPSILFLDRCGREVALRHTGYDGSDYFEFYLDKSVKQALAWLAKHPASCKN